jgi:hypothetical protein
MACLVLERKRETRRERFKRVSDYRLKIKENWGATLSSRAVELVRQASNRAVDEGGAGSHGGGRRNARWWRKRSRRWWTRSAVADPAEDFAMAEAEDVARIPGAHDAADGVRPPGGE